MDPMVIFPDREPDKPTLPPTHANSQAYYAATMYGTNPVEDYYTAKTDLETKGESELVNIAQAQWKQEQDTGTKDAIVGIINDPSVDVATKKAVISSYQATGFVSKDLREKYKQTIATKDLANTEADRRSQDLWITAMQQRDNAAKGVQAEITSFGTALDDNTVKAVAGIALDVFPAVWNARVAKTARQSGVDTSVYETVKSFLFTGSGNQEIKEAYNRLPVERKREFIQRVVESYKNSPGFDINAWQDFQAQIEGPESPQWVTTLEDVAGVLNVVGLGFLFKNLARGGKGAAKAPKTRPVEKGTPRPYTPEEPPELRTGETYEGEATLVTEDPLLLVGPKVDPVSPAGTTATANPQAAQKLGASAVADATEQMAQAAGVSRAGIIGDWLLPKIDEYLAQTYPDIKRDLDQLDKYMAGVFQETKFDPYILSPTQREAELEKYYNVIREVRGPHYQQANSILEQSARGDHGVARFGRNESYGFDTQAAAETAAKKVQASVNNLDKDIRGTVRVAQKDNQFYVEWEYNREYDPFEHLVFGDNSVSFKFAGIPLDGLARSILGKWLPPTMRMDTWVPFGAARAEMRAGKVENDFIKEVRANITSTKHKTELYNILRATEESGKYLSPQEISAMFPDLSSDSIKELNRSYAYYRRLVDYEYNWANRYDKARKSAGGYEAIYGPDGSIKGYGTSTIDQSNLSNVRTFWDMESGSPIAFQSIVDGRQIVRLESAVEDASGVYEYAVIGGKTKLGPLPHNTLPKIDGYIPRKNLENWYIKKTPTSLFINGVKVSDPERLRNHQKTIGAGDTAAEAEELAARFRDEFPDHIVEVRRERGDTADAVLTDYKVYKDSLEHGRKRGDRLPTVDGFARLEDPLISLIESIKTVVRLDAWKDYSDAFKTNWMKAYGRFSRTGEFPNNLNDLRSLEGVTEAEVRQFQSAQRLLEQYTRMQQMTSYGDVLWKEFFYHLSDVFEKLDIKWPHQLLKEVGKKGNLLVRGPKAVATKLFIDTNVLRQWLLQPQTLVELAAISPGFAKQSFRVIPAVLGALTGDVRAVSKYSRQFKDASQRIAGLPVEEFNAIVAAIRKSGVPQSVDMNMMLHGMFNDVERGLLESTGRKWYEATKQVVKAPFALGRSIGYTPAELTNQVGAWVFAKDRWQRLNPGKNWNTPEAIEEISNVAWEFTGSMSTRAGALPYQEGALSLLFQFAAVQHKAFFQLFSSKVLSGAEKARLAAARTLIYGAYGVPGGFALDYLIKNYASGDTQVSWNDWKRGLQDWAWNNMIRFMVDGADEKDPTDLAITAATSPMPQTLPYLDFLIELSKFGDTDPTTGRFPFMAAVGSVFESARDISALYRAKELDTPAALERAGREMLEMSSGYSNWAKAMMIKNYSDKMSKMGNPYGLSLTRAEMVGQLFGIISEKELITHEMSKTRQSREEFIDKHSRDIHEQLMKMRSKIGKEEFSAYVNRLNSLASFLDEDIQMEVKQRVFDLDRQSLLTKNESLFLYIMQNHKEKNDKFITNMEAQLRSSENSKEKELLEVLKKEGVFQ